MKNKGRNNRNTGVTSGSWVYQQEYKKFGYLRITDTGEEEFYSCKTLLNMFFRYLYIVWKRFSRKHEVVSAMLFLLALDFLMYVTFVAFGSFCVLITQLYNNVTVDLPGFSWYLLH